MRATTIIISMVIFMVFIIGATSLVLEQSSIYDVDLTGGGNDLNLNTLDQINKINESYEFIIGSGERLSGSTEDITQEGINTNYDDALASSFNVLYGSLKIMPSMIGYTANALRIPHWMASALLAIVVLVMVIAVVALIMGVIKGRISG